VKIHIFSLHAPVETIVSTLQPDAHALMAGTPIAAPTTLVRLEVLGADRNHGVLVISTQNAIAGGQVLGVTAVDWPTIDAGTAEFQALTGLLGRRRGINANPVELAPVPLLTLGKVPLEGTGALTPKCWVCG
jgi:hypothetical protein